MTLRKMMIPTMTTATERKIRTKATAVTPSHYDQLGRWWGCLAHSESLSASVNRVVVRQCLFVAGRRAT
jgi:hypothetical protein